MGALLPLWWLSLWEGVVGRAVGHKQWSGNQIAVEGFVVFQNVREMFL